MREANSQDSQLAERACQGDKVVIVNHARLMLICSLMSIPLACASLVG